MSKDKLILNPIKSSHNNAMSTSNMKMKVTGSLLLVLALAVAINANLFTQENNPNMVSLEDKSPDRSIASVRENWEKKAFESLQETTARELASVGTQPSVFDKFAIGALEGHYSIRKIDGKIQEIQYNETDGSLPRNLSQGEEFLQENLALFSDQAARVEQIHVENNEERVIEKYQLKDAKGRALAMVQVLLDKDHNLLSMTVQ